MERETAMKILKELHGKSLFAERTALETLIPELKESEDEKIRKTIIRFFKDNYPNETEMYDGSVTVGKAIAWLEKQGGNPAPININKMVMEYSQTKDGDLGLPVNCQIRAYRQGLTDAISTLNLEKQGSITKLNEEEENKLAKVVLTSCAESFINYLDAHKKEGKMCVSNGECEDIENAFHNAMWDRLHRYYCKYIEKQGDKSTSDTRYEVKAGGSLSVNGKPFDYEHATITQKDFAPKQELKKIEDEIEIPFGAKDSELQEATYYIPKGFHAEIDDDKVIIKKGEKSAAWSDEDENYLQSAENACEYQYGKNTSTILWLKSLKDRMKGKEKKK